MSTNSTSAATNREAESAFGMQLDRSKGHQPTSDNVSEFLWNSLKSREEASLNKPDPVRQLSGDRETIGAPEGTKSAVSKKSSKILRVDPPSVIVPASRVGSGAGREAAPPGVPLGNTAPQTRQKPYYRGSLDTAEFACHVQHAKHWPETMASLEQVRQTALKERNRQLVRIRGREWWVLNAHPVNIGKAQAQVILAANDVKILLSECTGYSKDQANLWVQVGSLPFLSCHRYETALDLYAFSFLERLGARVIRSSPQRLDYALDLSDLSMSYFAEAKQNGCYVSSSKKRRAYEGDDSGVETLYFGQRPNSIVRFYDKKLECKGNWNKGGQEKFNQIVANRFDGKEPEVMTRIEWELNRDTLRDKFGVDDWERDGNQKLGTIMEYMSHNFLRFTEEPCDRKNRNQSRVKTSAEWEHVQDSLGVNLQGKNEPLTKHEAKPMSFAEKYRTAWCYALGAMASEGFCTTDKGELLAYFEEKMLANIPDDWEERLAKKNELAEQRRFKRLEEVPVLEDEEELEEARDEQLVIEFE